MIVKFLKGYSIKKTVLDIYLVVLDNAKMRKKLFRTWKGFYLGSNTRRQQLGLEN